MQQKNKIILMLILFCSVVFGTGIAYSSFFSGSELEVEDQKIAKFVFESKQLDHLELNPTSLVPGDTEEYNFSVTNNLKEVLSNVTLNYQIIIKTYHFMPLKLELYKVTEDKEELIMTCDENYSRNENNELVCNSPEQEMTYTKEAIDNYKIKAIYPSEFDGIEYSDIVDYIDVEIKSWQKLG